MVWLIVGVTLWWVAHLGKSVGRPVRRRLLERLGEDKLKGLVALAVVTSVVLMVLGWRATTPSPLYAAPSWGYKVAPPSMFIALFLFMAAGWPNTVTRMLRHPQLTGVTVWAAAHLLANGDQRSTVLFGGLGVWAIVSIIAINVRDGAWKRPEPQPISTGLGLLAGAAASFALLWFVHRWITGVALVWVY